MPRTANGACESSPLAPSNRPATNDSRGRRRDRDPFTNQNVNCNLSPKMEVSGGERRDAWPWVKKPQAPLLAFGRSQPAEIAEPSAKSLTGCDNVIVQ